MELGAGVRDEVGEFDTYDRAWLVLLRSIVVDVAVCEGVQGVTFVLGRAAEAVWEELAFRGLCTITFDSDILTYGQQKHGIPQKHHHHSQYHPIEDVYSHSNAGCPLHRRLH